MHGIVLLYLFFSLIHWANIFVFLDRFQFYIFGQSFTFFLLLYLFVEWRKENFSFRLPPFFFPVTVYLFTAFVSMLFSSQPAASERFFYGEFRNVLWFSFLTVHLRSRKKALRVSHMMGVLYFFFFVLSVFVTADFLSFAVKNGMISTLISPNYRASGSSYSITNPGVIAPFLCIAVLFCFMPALEQRKRKWGWFYGVSFSVIFIAFLGNHGRDGFLGAAVGLLYFVFKTRGKGASLPIKWYGWIFFAVTVVALLAFWMKLYLIYFQSIPYQLKVFLRLSRLEIWMNSLYIVRDFPAFGCGAGTFSDVYPWYVRARYVAHPDMYFGALQSNAHNLYINLAVEQGLPVLFSFLWMTLTFLRWFSSHIHEGDEHAAVFTGLVASLVSFFVFSFFESMLHTGGASLLLWTLFALGSALASGSGAAADAPVKRMWHGRFVAGAIIFAVFTYMTTVNAATIFYKKSLDNMTPLSLDRAEFYIRKSLTFNPRSDAYYSALGKIYEYRGMSTGNLKLLKKAEAYYEKALSLRRHGEPIYRLLLQIERRLGNQQKVKRIEQKIKIFDVELKPSK